MHFMRKMIRSASVAAAALIASATTASAVQQIFSCDSTVAGNITTCTANCELITNITCSGTNANTPGITLTNGADLDLNGFSITFTGTNNLKSAVTAGANSIVKNLDNNNEGKVLGSYAGTTPAIKCTSSTGTKVTGVRVDISQGTGVLSCATVEDSVIISATTSAGDGITTAGTISNNYVSGFANGINAAPATVDHNIVNTQASQSSGMSAIFGVSTLTGNVILGPATTLINSTGSSSFAENYCDTSASNCTSCISSGFCSAVPVAPFDFP